MAVLIRALRLGRRLAGVLLVAAATLAVERVGRLRATPELGRWHTTVPRAELHARDLGPTLPWAAVEAREAALFHEVRERVFAQVPAADRLPTSRYTAGGPLDPATFSRDWNRSFRLEPERLRGGVLLVHGLTDSPYSLRTVAEIYRRAGFFALAVRMPGHGTVPAALTDVVVEDWLAMVRAGARAVGERIGPGSAFHVVGYSNGAAVALAYALAAARGSGDRRPDRVVLFSPMVGVTASARWGGAAAALAVLPGLAKAGWVDVLPEYNPFKYNSFPAAAGYQTHRLTAALRRDLRRAGGDTLAALPPVLAFQSVLDATVDAGAVARDLFDRLPGAGSELVLFDSNRASSIQPFLRVSPDAAVGELFEGPRRSFTATLLTNAGVGDGSVHERTRPAGSDVVRERPLGLRWPENVFSLSHVALPFPPDDPLYGLTPDPGESYGVRLSLVVPRGERRVLIMPAEATTRLYCNPFFGYVEARLQELLRTPAVP